MTYWHPLFISIVSILLVFPASAQTSDIERGKGLYLVRCVACHSSDYNGVGPAHRGVFMREAGKASGYPYSTALKNSKLIWNEANLNQWLADPEKLLPGQKMGLAVPEPQARADLIAYLKTLVKK